MGTIVISFVLGLAFFPSLVRAPSQWMALTVLAESLVIAAFLIGPFLWAKRTARVLLTGGRDRTAFTPRVALRVGWFVLKLSTQINQIPVKVKGNLKAVSLDWNGQEHVESPLVCEILPLVSGGLRLRVIEIGKLSPSQPAERVFDVRPTDTSAALLYAQTGECARDGPLLLDLGGRARSFGVPISGIRNLRGLGKDSKPPIEVAFEMATMICRIVLQEIQSGSGP